MRIFTIHTSGVSETSALNNPTAYALPEQSYLWIACSRNELESRQNEIQAT